MPDLYLHITNSRPTILRPSAEIELYWESKHVVLARHMRFAADISVSGQLIVLDQPAGDDRLGHICRSPLEIKGRN